MPRRFTLEPLRNLAHDRVDAATQRLATLKAKWQQEETKLGQLRQFDAEYQKRLGEAIRLGMDMTRMRDFQVFIRKLETAMQQQTHEITRAKVAWEEGQRVWLEERRKAKTYDVLKGRHLKAEQHQENRLEQREADEHARKMHSTKKGLDS